MATPKPETGVVTVNTGFRPKIAHDSGTELARIGITDVKLIETYRIKTNPDFVETGNLLVTARTVIKEISAGYKDAKQEAHEAHAAICANEKADLATWVAIEKVADREVKSWRQKLDREKREAEERQRREDAERARQAQAEADRIEREAQEAARALRAEGDIRASREVVAVAQEKAQVVVQQAQQLADLGMILPDNTPKVEGLGGAFKWKGREAAREDDPDYGMLMLIKAIAAGKVSLRHLTPTRGGAPEMRRIVDLDGTVVNEIAARMRSENLQIPGIEGFKDFSSRVTGPATKAAPVRAETRSDSEDWL